MNVKSILIVDDSDIDQYLAKYTVKKCNAEIDIQQAYDGQEALDLLATLPEIPNVILLDVNMPRMNGHEFLIEYEKQNGTKANVIMLSSSEEKSDKQKALAHSCVKHYLTKPLDMAELSAAI